ncbi:MAG: polyphosphate kinase, partial [Ilumatobacteraceae bacterium]|nr:polyphosphate kinase [Ilumatobacteraceae bacterium]
MSGRLLNREVSWLDFNRRVLALAQEPGIPLLERMKFLAICSSNLDEFFQVRISALKDQVAAGVVGTSYDGLSPSQQLAAIGPNVEGMVIEQEKVLLDVLVPELAERGVRLVTWDDLGPDDRAYLVDVYEQRIFPVLTPLAVDPAHPFPYISNLALSLAAMVSDPETGERRFARVKVPTVFPRLLGLPDGVRFLLAEELIAAQLHSLFVGMVVEEHAVFRVTRNVDLTLEDEDADDLLAAVEMELRRRRFGRAVRVEVQAGISDEMLELLLRELELLPSDVTAHRAPLDLTCLWQLHALDRPELKDRPWPPVTAGRIAAAEEADRSIFSVIRERPLMVHHPYESFASSSESFIAQAADDPRVQSIKMTLYRAGGDSPIARSLMRAAERGVQVAVLVELKARFDEATNVTWAKALERAGVHVVYGFVGLKTHAKCVLVVRADEDGLRRYCHIGTGNYNSRTARLYEDVGILTCNEAVGDDVAQLFNHLTGYSRAHDYVSLLVAPRDMRGQLIDLIEQEAALGSEGRITAKLNSLGDPAVVEALYAASQAGVQIDLVVRGICCLRPGVPGLSENIHVQSIVGRFLEHSRICVFGNG